jgi:hypothetical protein
MPYVAAKARPALDAAVEKVALKLVMGRVCNGYQLLKLLKEEFAQIVCDLEVYLKVQPCATWRPTGGFSANPIAHAVWYSQEKYQEGEFLGYLNYAITRLVQRLPQLMVENEQLEETEEFRYWMYAMIVDALNYVSVNWVFNVSGIAGVFVDIKDEYKWRANRGYEIAQIEKSGDCYDTPYYSRLAEVTDDLGRVGFIEVFVKRSRSTPVSKAALTGKIKLV